MTATVASLSSGAREPTAQEMMLLDEDSAFISLRGAQVPWWGKAGQEKEGGEKEEEY